MRIPEIVKPKPLHKTVPSLAGADSAGRIKAAWLAMRSARASRTRTKLADIPPEIRPAIARQYRIGAAGFVLTAVAMAWSGFAFSSAMPGFSVAAVAVAAPACLWISIMKMWQAAMIERGRGLGFREFLFSGSAD